jgi:hypothetical protein
MRQIQITDFVVLIKQAIFIDPSIYKINFNNLSVKTSNL